MPDMKLSLVYDKCCGCIELKTGCLIIGYLELVVEIIFSIIIFITLVIGGAAASSDVVIAHAAGVALLVIGCILLLIVTLLLAFTITLLVGLHQNKRGHVKAYLIYAAIFMVLSVIMFFASLSQSIPASSIICNVIILLIHLYFILVIRSYYLKMEDNEGVV